MSRPIANDDSIRAGNQPDPTAPPIPDGWSGEPLFIAFFFTLPLSLGLPAGWNYNFDLPGEVDWLKGQPMVPEEGFEPLSSDGSNFVSPKVWRPKRHFRISGQPLSLAMQVINVVTGNRHEMN